MTDRPTDAEIEKWHRFFAIECNNQAWALADQTARSAADTVEMLDAAHAAALHWRRVGTELNAMRADMLLAHAHALARDGAFALDLARRVLDYFAHRDTPDWEIAFVHAVLANAAHASGETALHRTHHAEAERLGHAIADAEDRRIFFKTFANVPRPVPGATPLFGDVSNVRVFVDDMAAAVRFYRDVLGLRLRWETPTVAIFDTGRATLMIEPAEPDEGGERLVGRFLGVTLAAPDIAAAYRSLSERGVQFLHPPQAQAWGGIMTHFRDPSGNVVTAVQYSPQRIP